MSEPAGIGPLMALVRLYLYAPDGNPPAGWHPGRDVKLLWALRRQATDRELADAIEGIRRLCDRGALSWARPGSKLTLRALYRTHLGARPTLAVALDAVHQTAPRERDGTAPARVASRVDSRAPQPLSALLGSFLEK